MCHNSLSLCRHTCIQQKLLADLEKKLEKLMDEVKVLRQQHNFPDDLILNMNETPIYFDMPRSSTVTKKGAKEVHNQLRHQRREETGGIHCVMFSSRSNSEAHGHFQGKA